MAALFLIALIRSNNRPKFIEPQNENQKLWNPTNEIAGVAVKLIPSLPMEKDLVARLEAAVARLEALPVAGFHAGISPSGAAEAQPVDPAILAFEELAAKFLGRVSAAAEKIGGKVLEATRILEEAFAVKRDLLIKAKQSQVDDLCFDFTSIVYFACDLVYFSIIEWKW